MAYGIIEFLLDLESWRAERRLTTEGQREGYLSNVLEEMAEYADAARTNNSHEKIDAICDMLVFSGNIVPISSLVSNEILDIPVPEKHTLQFLAKKMSAYKRVADTIIEGRKHEEVSLALYELFAICEIIAKEDGYDLYKSLKEVAKQINSRTGAWSAEKNKWIKDTSPEAKAKEYQADFDKCRVSAN